MSLFLDWHRKLCAKQKKLGLRMSSSYSASALLKLYGSKAVNVTDVMQHFYPDTPAPKPADAHNLKIGTEYIPPLGGISIIDPAHVANAGHANRLRQAGYRPQSSPDNGHGRSDMTAATSAIALGLLMLAGLVGVIIMARD